MLFLLSEMWHLKPSSAQDSKWSSVVRLFPTLSLLLTAVGFANIYVTPLLSFSRFLLMDDSIYLKGLTKLNYVSAYSKCLISISYYYYYWITGVFSYFRNKPMLLKVFPYPCVCHRVFFNFSSSLHGQNFGRVYLNVSSFLHPKSSLL